MTETKTPETTPSPKPQVTVGKPESPQSVFVVMALDMGWRLAIVVLVPVVGGFELDTHLGTTPLLTVIGFILAMVGSGFVMWQTLQTANSRPVTTKSSAKKEVKPEKRQ